jgi:hypothetical protein
MITPQEIEAFALKLTAPDFVVSGANIALLIGHLDDHDYELVMGRAQEIRRERHPPRRRPATPAELALRERAARLGFKLSRRGQEYSLTDPDGTGVGGMSLDGINEWLDVIEYKLPVQISSPCGMPLFKINDPDKAAEAETDHGGEAAPGDEP